jgi:hypothetical protein
MGKRPIKGPPETLQKSVRREVSCYIAEQDKKYMKEAKWLDSSLAHTQALESEMNKLLGELKRRGIRAKGVAGLNTARVTFRGWIVNCAEASSGKDVVAFSCKNPRSITGLTPEDRQILWRIIMDELREAPFTSSVYPGIRTFIEWHPRKLRAASVVKACLLIVNEILSRKAAKQK